jgi:hypothetical protein
MNQWHMCQRRLCFSRGGFHPDLVAEASHTEKRILLIDADRLYFKDFDA